MQKITLILGFLTLLSPVFVQAQSADSEKEEGFVSLFDGKTLDGWDGNPAIWSVKDGIIVGQTAKEGDAHLTYNQFLIYKGEEFGNFILKADIKLSQNGNSGFQYRSKRNEKPWSVSGYQADFDGIHAHSGILYGEGYGGILTNRGTESVLEDGPRRKSEKRFADGNELKKELKIEDWNAYELRVEGSQYTHIINGKVISITNDEGEKNAKTGIIAVQAHVTNEPMRVELKNLRIKKLP
ncbi:hypothetical protein FACS189419_08740 [Planctomycetales bacterium]|nr:hypothetical protein FACS189419_08740 [Planctomycetales bacterium]